MFEGAKKLIRNKVVGQPIKDFGIVFQQNRGIITEQLELGIYQKNTGMNILFRISHKLIFIPNVFYLVLAIGDLPRFVSTIKSNYEKLCRMVYAPGLVITHGSDKLPWNARLFIKPIYGIKASKLLLDSKDPSADIDIEIYGFITRKSEMRVFFSKSYISSDKGWVISGDALSAALKALSTFLEDGAGMGSDPSTILKT